MKIFAENERYDIKVDSTQNIMYIAIKGYWRVKDGYLEDLEKACVAVKSGFKIQVDLLTMKAPLAEVGEVHKKAQHLLMTHGLSQTAEVQADNAITRMAAKKYSDSSGMKKRVFFTHEEAKEWLEEG